MPTFLEAAGVDVPETVTGRSFLDVLQTAKSGWVDESRNRMLVGKERHDLGRPDDLGYPVRALRTPEFLYVHNYEPDRWPVCNPETGYGNCDDSPTKQHVLNSFDDHYRLCFGKRPEEELYRVADDPECLKNLAADPSLQATKRQLREEMETMLQADGDPRVLGRGEVFDTYKYVGGRKHSYQAWLEHRQ
jgi:arylsulfatase A-like enzyme